MANELYTNPASVTMVQALKIRTLIASSSVFQAAVGVETVEEAEAVTAIDLADTEIALARLAIVLACRIDTGSSGQVGSFHGVLLEEIWFVWRTSYDLTSAVNPNAIILGHHPLGSIIRKGI